MIEAVIVAILVSIALLVCPVIIAWQANKAPTRQGCDCIYGQCRLERYGHKSCFVKVPTRDHEQPLPHEEPPPHD